MKRFVSVALLFGVIVVGLVYWLSPDPQKSVEFFADKIRASLFTGLLTVGSFLLSLKVFIVVKFKETIFDTKEYKDRLEDLRKIDPALEHYAPVRNLSAVLFVAIASAISAAACQLTIGLLQYPLAMLICVFMAAFAGAMLMQTLILIKNILTEWLDHMEIKPSGG